MYVAVIIDAFTTGKRAGSSWARPDPRRARAPPRRGVIRGPAEPSRGAWPGTALRVVSAACASRPTRIATSCARSRRSPPPHGVASRSSTPRTRTGGRGGAWPQRAAALTGASSLRRRRERARIVTKGGMARPGGVGSGRPGEVDSLDCEASLEALDGLPIDLYLLHAPDPRTPWRTSLRALSRLVDDGLVRHVGVANVNRPQLDEALCMSRSPPSRSRSAAFDDRALRGGVVERVRGRDIAVIAHSPLGGPRGGGLRASRHLPTSQARGATRGRGRARVAARPLVRSWSRSRRAPPGAARSALARAACTRRARPNDARSRSARVRRRGAHVRPADAEVVLVMGIPGAGRAASPRSTSAAATPASTATSAVGRCASSPTRSTRRCRRAPSASCSTTRTSPAPSRSYVIDARRARGAGACIWLDIPLAQAQVNLVERLLERFGALPTPEELRVARGQSGRARADLADAGAPRARAAVGSTRVASVRARAVRPRSGLPGGGAGCVRRAPPRSGQRSGRGAIALKRSVGPAAPTLLFDWSRTVPLRMTRRRRSRGWPARVRGPVETGLCRTRQARRAAGAGPRLPGLLIAFAREARPSTPAALGPGRNEPRPPDARRDARGTLRVGLSDRHSNRRCRRRAPWPTQRGAARALPWTNRREGDDMALVRKELTWGEEHAMPETPDVHTWRVEIRERAGRATGRAALTRFCHDARRRAPRSEPSCSLSSGRFGMVLTVAADEPDDAAERGREVFVRAARGRAVAPVRARGRCAL